MSIVVQELPPKTGGHDTRRLLVVVDGDASIASFKQLTQRAANLWPDAPAEIKRFADDVTNELQYIDSQYTENKNTRPIKEYFHKCSCGYVTPFRYLADENPTGVPIRCENTEFEYVWEDATEGTKTKKAPCRLTKPYNPA